jgi:hypothetical protein
MEINNLSAGQEIVRLLQNRQDPDLTQGHPVHIHMPTVLLSTFTELTAPWPDSGASSPHPHAHCFIVHFYGTDNTLTWLRGIQSTATCPLFPCPLLRNWQHPDLTQGHPVHSHMPTVSLSTLSLSSHARLCLQSEMISQSHFSTNIYKFLAFSRVLQAVLL